MNKHKCHLEMKGNHSDGQSVRLSGCGSGLKHQLVREHAVSRRTLTVKKSPKILSYGFSGNSFRVCKHLSFMKYEKLPT